VETDPKFTQYKQWSSSDYLLNALQMDPATTQKRLGDGFYEQKLIREQVLALTGHRFLADYTSDEQEYKALMDNGATVAKQWNLRPGVALSPEQIAQLTSDIVWLVTQEVTLPDGSHQSVLVPQLYVRVRPGDVHGDGGLLSGSDVNINLSGDVANSGTVAGRNLVRISADNIRNMGGNMVADTLALQATKDIDNIGGAMQAQSAAVLSAGHDINVTTTTQSTTWNNGANSYSLSGVDRVAGLYVSGPAGVLLASAGNNINLTAAQVGNSGNGLTQFSADHDLNLDTVTTGRTRHEYADSNNHLDSVTSKETGTQIKVGGALTLNAGQDVNARAATVSADQALTVLAGRDVNITAGQVKESFDEASQQSSHGFLSKKSTATHDQMQSTTAIGSSLEGATVNMQAGRDLQVKGSSILADQDVTLHAAGDVKIVAAQDTFSESHFQQGKRSGLMDSGGVGIMLGSRMQGQDQGQQMVSTVASTIGSLGGNVAIGAGKTYLQTGSDILTPQGNVDILAQTVNINEARETGSQHSEQKFRQGGITVLSRCPISEAG